MTAARDDILDRLRRANGRGGPPDAAARAALRRRIAAHAPNLIPRRAQGDHAALTARFVDMAREASATVARVQGGGAVPAEVARFLAAQQLAPEVAMAPDPTLDDLPWPEQPSLSLRRGRAEPTDAVGVTPAVAGIAETGTLMVVSGRATPNTLHFLPDTHIAVLRADDVVGAYEDAWARLRARTAGALPRAVTLITGPSRSSDIERTVQIGVHGPRLLHIILVDGEKA